MTSIDNLARSRLSYLIALCTGTAVAPAADAQEVPSRTLDGFVEEVVVTGSRMVRSNANTAQPISTISAETLRQTGTTDIGEILNDNPALLSSITSSNSLDNEPGNVGAADNVGGSALDLRGLGFHRTLTLVNGRRHVSGIEGTLAVDISTIPSALIESVEVLTGGASAVYGADAVTGVVNIVLKDDFEGFELDLRPGVSGEGDAETSSLSLLFGRNFNERHGNVIVSFQHEYSAGLRQGDRDFLANDGMHDDDANPALRFQHGDIDAASTPNFSRYYDFSNTGLYPAGLRIPTAESFIAQYEQAFGETPALTAAELALIERAATAPPRVFLPGRTFNVTSPYGVVAIGTFGTGSIPLGAEPDVDGDGTPDCLQSFTGYNSTFAGAASFGGAGGCWFLDESGNPVPYKDGLIASNFNQFGASQSFIAPNSPYVLPKEEKYAVNFNGRYEFSPKAELFWESKYVYHEVEFGGGGHNFTDLLYGAPDNPFLPEALKPYADNEGHPVVGPGGLYISRDSDDWGPNISTNERTTYRLVTGARGSFDKPALDYEISANFGRFERKLIDREAMITDRFFAAIDVVTHPETGEPVCRSDLDPTAYPPTTPFNIPTYVGGGAPSPFFTFTPGDRQCKPANIWGGRGAISQEAIDFFTYDRIVEESIEQSVVTGFISGDSSRLFSLPGGPVGFVLGAEWREEKSRQTFDEYDRGIIQVAGVTPDGTPYSPGDFVGDVSNAAALGADPSTTLANTDASYDVWDVFAELSLPLLASKPFADELTIDAAVRRADYSTFGNNTTYRYGLVWAPVSDVRFRANYSRAIRVPNLFELYSPEQGQRFRPVDPCDAGQISQAPDPALRQANCVAHLASFNVPLENVFDASGNYIFDDPLSAGFPGVIGGNPNLEPEDATTKTFGVVLQPPKVDRLVLSLDYWDIVIDDAISSISAQNIVNGCYDAPSINNPFCELIQRNSNPTSAQAGGFTFLRQTMLNFGAAEASGWDFNASYTLEAGRFIVGIDGIVTKQNKLKFIEPTNPGEPPSIDDELGEMRRPEWSSQLSVNVSTGRISASWQTQYLSEQVLGYEDGGEIETALQNFGPAAFTDDVLIHNVSGAYDASDRLRLYGGIANVTDVKPFVTERSYPVSPVGRAFYVGVNFRL
ncbi:MAG: TonB-dependent receptor [Gammaproteobacteria bacterium]